MVPLSKVIERGLAIKDSDDANNIIDMAPQETVQELTAISDELLNKAGLIEMNEKLETFWFKILLILFLILKHHAR